MNKLYLKYVTHSLDNFYSVLVGGSVILYLITHFTKKPAFARYGFLILCFCILFKLVHTNQRNLYKYMTINRHVSHLPARQIRLINNIFLSFYMGITVAVMYVLSKLPYDRVIRLLKAAAKLLQHLLIAFFALFKEDSPQTFTDAARTAANEMSFDLSGLGQKDTAAWALILDKLARILTLAFLLAVFVGILWKLYKKLSERNYADKDIEVREFITPEMTREKLSRDNTSKSKWLFTDMSPSGRIRKLYIRSVKKQLKKDQIPSSASTPKEIEQFTGMEANTRNQMLHQYYEKARYSKDGCGQDDWEKLKKNR